MGRMDGTEADPPDPATRVSAWQSEAYPPLESLSGVPGPHAASSANGDHGRKGRRGPVRLAVYLLVLLGLGAAACFVGPTAVSWVGDLFSEPEPTPISAECTRAFSTALETEAAEDRVKTLLECTERDWKAQQATTPMDDVSFEALCAFRGELVAEACVGADAQRLIRANIEAQKTTTSAPPAVEDPPGGPAPETARSYGSRQAAPPQYVPQPAPNPGFQPAPVYPDPMPSTGNGNPYGGGGGAPGPSFSQPPAPSSGGPPGPSF